MTSNSPQGATRPAGESNQAPTCPADAAVHAVGVSKTFGSVRALKNVDLTVRQGTVHALVGENGSGKSTLTKIIAGAHQPDKADIWLSGNHIDQMTPRAALNAGVRVIYQDLALFPNMTVAENIGFDGAASAFGRVPHRADEKRANDTLEMLGLDIPANRVLRDLSTAERQLVAIARAVSSDGRIILMDEPTAALTQSEIDSFLETIRRLAASGLSFVFISHKLREVVDIADDVTVIRDGAIVASGTASEFTQERISYLMTGTTVENQRRETPPPASGEAVLACENLGLGDVFSNVDLQLHAGRILGLSGLVGCGKIEIGLALAGLIHHDTGKITYRGERLKNPRPVGAIQYVPDDRLTEGLFLDWSIADNMVANSLEQTRDKMRLISASRLGELGGNWKDKLRIKAPNVNVPAAALSGGNQQRVLLARALAPHPDVVILNNPTVGVDVGSRAEIHDIIRDMADANTAVLLISDEPAELLSVCDDIHFVFGGQIVHHAAAASLDEEAIIDINGKGGLT